MLELFYFPVTRHIGSRPMHRSCISPRGETAVNPALPLGTIVGQGYTQRKAHLWRRT